MYKYVNDFINLSSPRPAQTVPFVILLCLMPNDFTHQWRASGWERVNVCAMCAICVYSFVIA